MFRRDGNIMLVKSRATNKTPTATKEKDSRIRRGSNALFQFCGTVFAGTLGESILSISMVRSRYRIVFQSQRKTRRSLEYLVQ